MEKESKVERGRESEFSHGPETVTHNRIILRNSCLETFSRIKHANICIHVRNLYVSFVVGMFQYLFPLLHTLLNPIKKYSNQGRKERQRHEKRLFT